MSVPAAYAAVVLVWSTTPLAIQASGGGDDALLGLALRMLLGLMVLLLISLLRPAWRPRLRGPMQPYLATAIPLYTAMTAVYLAAQLIPSGWISVIFGTTPALTGVLAYRFLGEQRLSQREKTGIAISLAGLAVLGGAAQTISLAAIAGVGLVLFSALVHSGGAIWLKRCPHPYSSIQTTIGGLLLATPMFFLTWLLTRGGLPDGSIQIHLAPIIYLGVFGTALGFPLYYYLLRELPAAKVALITLITPALGVMLGVMINNEPFNLRIASALALVVIGLAVYQFSLKSLPKPRRCRI